MFHNFTRRITKPDMVRIAEKRTMLGFVIHIHVQ